MTSGDSSSRHKRRRRRRRHTSSSSQTSSSSSRRRRRRRRERRRARDNSSEGERRSEGRRTPNYPDYPDTRGHATGGYNDYGDRGRGGRNDYGGYGGQRGRGDYGRGGNNYGRGGGYRGGGGIGRAAPDLSNLVPFKKNFYVEHPSVASMTSKEMERHLADHRIEILEGSKVPKPVPVWDCHSFDEQMIGMLQKKEFLLPRPVQVIGIPVAMSGHDMIGIAETGSGKTLAFVLPAIYHIEAQVPVRPRRGHEPTDGPVALVLAPTRELCIQIAKDAMDFAEPRGINVACVYGGAGLMPQIQRLESGAAFVVACPGRLKDISLNRRVINFNRVTYFVLDEADRMLDMGFQDDIRTISDSIRPDRQTLMFSATWPSSVDRLASQIFRQENLVKVAVGYKSGGDVHLVDGLKWEFIEARGFQKQPLLEK